MPPDVPFTNLDEGNTMPDSLNAIDLPPNVAAGIQLESVGNIQLANARNRDLSGTVDGVLRGSMARRFDETGVAEGKVQSGLLATDVGGPTNAGK